MTSWSVDVGDTVQRGDIICEVETNKGDIDVEIWEGGVVEELLIEPGKKVPVGEVLAIVDNGEEVEEVEEVEPKAEEIHEEAAPAVAPMRPDPADLRIPKGIMASPAARRRAAELGVDLEGVEGTGLQGAITVADVERGRAPRISPVARRMADEEGIDVATIEGSGPGGAIRRGDVEAAVADRKGPQEVQEEVEEEVAEEPGEETSPMAAMREAIAVAMARSKREIPHYYLQESVPMHNAQQWLRDYNEDRPASQRLLPGVILIKAVALACREFPQMNGVFQDDSYEAREDINPGFAISLRQGGVIPPAVHEADKKELPQLMDDLRDLVRRVRRGKLRSSEITDATITITSLGEMGVEAVYGVIYPPQVAIVGFGKISERFWSEDGLMGSRPVMTATLSGDHRVSDGIAGARFLSTIADYLQRPEDL